MNKWILLLTIVIGILFIWMYIKIADFTPDNKDDELLQRINRIELKLDSIKSTKDSIRNVIDSTHVKIITNEKHYQERINTILIQPSSADSSYISNYIRLHRSQRDSANIY